jgi:undecaprenyl-diphosphatase
MAVSILYSIIIGLVQGISEWLPISSKTQVLFTSTVLLGFPLAVAYAFGLFMEIGSTGSAIIYFRREVVAIFRDIVLFKFVLIVTLVTGLIAVPLYLFAENLLVTSPYPLGIPMIILGVALIADSLLIWRSKQKTVFRVNNVRDLKLREILLIGIAQGLSALPGVSRSGATISTMLMLGIKPETAFRLSYLVYIPASLGAFLASLVLTKSQVSVAVSQLDVYGLAIAIVVAFLTGLIVIRYLLRFAKNNSIYIVTLTFGILAIVFGIIISFYVLPAGASLT